MKEKRLQAGNIFINAALSANRKPPVLFIHGLSANHHIWKPMIDNLGSDMKAILPDLRGRGQSDKPEGPYSIDTHVKDMHALLDTLKIDKVTIVGHSLGAMIGLMMSVKYPEKVNGLVLMDGAGKLPFKKKLNVLKVIRPSLYRLKRTYSSLEDYLQTVQQVPVIKNWSPAVEQYLKTELIKEGESFVTHMPYRVAEAEIESVGGSIEPADMLKKLLLQPIRTYRKIQKAGIYPYEKVQCPVLIIQAAEQNIMKDDHLLPEEAITIMQKSLKESFLLRLPANHYGIVMDDLPQRDAQLKNFVKRVST